MQKIIGYTFGNEDLLIRALTHSSFKNEMKIGDCGDYERLEFLGDAVLELVSSDFLFARYEDLPEGKLSKIRASAVCEPTLAMCAREFDLQEYIRLGRGEEKCGGRDNDSIISDVCEAVIGAIYLDGGMEPARAFINSRILNDFDNKKLFFDSKSTLQEFTQGRDGGSTPRYELVSEAGEGREKLFITEVYIDDEKFAEGRGKSKKASEQDAAYKALLALKDRGYVLKEY